MRLCAAFAHYTRMGQGTQILICFVLLVALYCFILWRLNEQHRPPRPWSTNGHDRAVRQEMDGTALREIGWTGTMLRKGRAQRKGERASMIFAWGGGRIFTLPIMFAPQLSISNEMPQSAPSAVRTTAHEIRSHILVVDDAPDNLTLIRIYLSDCNFELDYAENGHQGRTLRSEGLEGRRRLVGC
jgi:hypothetical protein